MPRLPLRAPALAAQPKVVLAPRGPIPPPMVSVQTASRGQLKQECLDAGAGEEQVNGKTVKELRDLLAQLTQHSPT